MRPARGSQTVFNLRPGWDILATFCDLHTIAKHTIANQSRTFPIGTGGSREPPVPHCIFEQSKEKHTTANHVAADAAAADDDFAAAAAVAAAAADDLAAAAAAAAAAASLCIALQSFALHCFAKFCFALLCIAMHCFALLRIAWHCMDLLCLGTWG